MREQSGPSKPRQPAGVLPLDELPDLPVAIEEVLAALDQGRSARLDPEQVDPDRRGPG